MRMPLNPTGPIAVTGATIADPAQPIDYAAVRTGGVEAVYFRVAEGCGPSAPALPDGAAQAANAGLSVGCFHVMNAETPAQARAQARRFLDSFRGLPWQLRPALRIGNLDALQPDAANALALEFLLTVEYASGVVPLLCLPAERAGLLWSASVADRFPLWVIDERPDGPNVFASPWEGWTGWQYANAPVAGISGPVPLSRFTQGIFAETENACPEPPSDSKLICVTTVYGDTLSGIAALFGTTPEAIARINAIADPNRLFPGTRLFLRVPLSTPVAPCGVYTVRQGDTLSGIAARLGVGVDDLIARNQIANPSLIVPGQALSLP